MYYFCEVCGVSVVETADTFDCPTHPGATVKRYSDATLRDFAIERYCAVDSSYTPARHGGRIKRLIAVLQLHPNATVESCADERTGERYGSRECRVGRAEKIGYTTNDRQFWAVWP